MMPLMLASVGEEVMIARVKGKEELIRHMEDLGFVPGSRITVVSKNGGDLIVKVKEARIAISSEMAGKIFV